MSELDQRRAVNRAARRLRQAARQYTVAVEIVENDEDDSDSALQRLAVADEALLRAAASLARADHDWRSCTKCGGPFDQCDG